MPSVLADTCFIHIHALCRRFTSFTLSFIPSTIGFSETYADKRLSTEMPPTLCYQTKPEIALELLRQALTRGSVRARHMAADALYGNNRAFRDGVAALNLYVLHCHLVRYTDLAASGRACCALLLWQRAQAEQSAAENAVECALSSRSTDQTVAQKRLEAHDHQGRQQRADSMRCGDNARDGSARRIAGSASVAPHPPQRGRPQ
jgi:hypothetical protein